MSFQNLKIELVEADDIFLTVLEDTVAVLGKYSPGHLNRDLLGGKGYSLVAMVSQGLKVPRAFIIPTTYGNRFVTAAPGSAVYKDRMAIVDKVLQSEYLNAFLGTGHTIFSVRSGARVSMAGMMDTVLNVCSLSGHSGFRANHHDHQDFVDDCQNRFLSMFSKSASSSETFTVEQFNKHYLSQEWATADHVTRAKPWEHVKLCALLVFESWNNERAKYYRKVNNIPDDLGTAVIVQQMVFGNLSENSYTGVVFSRNPNTGENRLTGEFLAKAQGEDVVSGSHTPKPISKLPLGLAYELKQGVKKLEYFMNDVQDVEFTVEDGKLFFLQTRDAKRTVPAALKIIRDMEEENPSTPGRLKRRLKNLDINTLAVLDLPVLKPTKEAHYKGLGSCPGGLSGLICRSLEDILTYRTQGKTIYLAVETTPDDIHCLDKADAILTMRGGSTSHAAVVARAMNKPCVVGVTELLDVENLKPGAPISIDGSTGEVWMSEQPVESNSVEIREEFLYWFFERNGTPLVVHEVTEVDMVCNRLQKSSDAPQFYSFPKESHVSGMTTADTFLWARGLCDYESYLHDNMNKHGVIPLDEQGKTSGNKVKRVGSLIELMKAEVPAQLTKTAAKDIDPEVLKALQELRAKLYGVAVPVKAGQYIQRSQAYKALAVLKNTI